MSDLTRAEKALSPRVYRVLFGFAWFVAVPLALRILIVTLFSPGQEGPASSFETLIRDQPVPVAIVVFSLADMLLWSIRHRLPFVALAYPPPRTDLKPDHLELYEKSRSLIDEARSIIAKNGRAIRRTLSDDAQLDLQTSLTELESAIRAKKFEADDVEAAYTRTSERVEKRLGRWRKSEGREFLESILVAVGVAMALRVFVLEAFKIPSGSMIPTLQVGDHIFVNKFVYGPAIPFTQARAWNNMPPARGDVMVFAYPENPELDYIKRVIAVPGDKLEARGGHPWINDWQVPNCLAGTYSYTDGENGGGRHEGDLFVEFLGGHEYLSFFDKRMAGSPEYQGPFFVKPNEVYVMGDNRNNSHDSRMWWGQQGGGVPYANIRGRALFVWLSISEKGFDWSRLGTMVMGRPRVPPALRDALEPGITKCLRDKPPFEKTMPPAQRK